MTTHPIEPGAMAFLIRDSEGLYGSRGEDCPRGFQFTVAEFVPMEDEWRGVDGYIQTDFYIGHSAGGWNNVAFAAEDVAELRSKAEMDARQGPSLAQLTEWVADSLGDIDGGSVYSADRNDADGTVEFGGMMDNGLDFAFTVRITDFGVVES